jgi:DNA-binding MarR family transcriptional regulator
VQLSTPEVVAVAEFRAALRQFLRTSERVARQSGLTPQRYLLLLMVKGAADGSEQSTVTELVSRALEAGLLQREQSSTDARVGNLRLSEEGERRLTRAFATLAAERSNVRQAFAHLDAEIPV